MNTHEHSHENHRTKHTTHEHIAKCQKVRKENTRLRHKRIQMHSWKWFQISFGHFSLIFGRFFPPRPRPQESVDLKIQTQKIIHFGNSNRHFEILQFINFEKKNLIWKLFFNFLRVRCSIVFDLLWVHSGLHSGLTPSHLDPVVAKVLLKVVMSWQA